MAELGYSSSGLCRCSHTCLIYGMKDKIAEQLCAKTKPVSQPKEQLLRSLFGQLTTGLTSV